MEKIKKIINKYDVLFIIIIATIANVIWMQVEILSSNDAIWDFQILYKMHIAKSIYANGINVIITPLFFIIGEIFINVFGANFGAFSIYSATMNIVTITIIYLIIKELNPKAKNNIPITIILVLYFREMFFANNANYNLLALLWCLISVLIGIKNKRHKIKLYNIIQGILCFFVLFTKQNIGVFFLVGITIADLIEKEEIKTKIQNIFTKYFVIGICGVIFLIYLFTTKTWNNFEYYVLSGIGEFTQNFKIFENPRSKLEFIGIVLCGVIFSILGIKYKKFSEEQNKNMYFLMPISICMMAVIYPIINLYHIEIASMIGIIFAIYTIRSLFDFPNTKIFNRALIIALILLCATSIYIVLKYANIETIRVEEKNNPLYGIRIMKEEYENILKIDEYVLEKEKQGINVIMAYYRSGAYMLPIEHFNGMFDCLNTGNFGRDGTKGIIQKIDNMRNTEIIIPTNENMFFWQEPKDIREYIKNNLEKKGEILEFSIYATQTEGE